MTALIDADSLLYKAGFSYEEKIDWNELELELNVTKESSISITSNVIEAKNAIDGLIENIMFKTGADDYELWLTGKGNFRYNVLDSYKSNRKDSRKPVSYTELWNYLMDKYDAHVAVGYEADDVVVHKKTKYPEEYFLCAIDKDVLYQSVGTHYNYGKDEFIEVTQEEAKRFFYFQVLAGDPVDGYCGCPNIGKVKANRILDDAEMQTRLVGVTMNMMYWRYVIEAYEAKDLTEDYAIQQARMASMHQLKEVSLNEYKVVLWNP